MHHCRGFRWLVTTKNIFPVPVRKVQQESYPWYQLRPTSPKARQTVLPAMGALPREWKWGADFLPAMLKWLQEL